MQREQPKIDLCFVKNIKRAYFFVAELQPYRKNYVFLLTRVGENIKLQAYMHLRLSAARIKWDKSALWGASISTHLITFYSSALVPHFLSLFDILLSVVLDPACSLQQGCACCRFRSHRLPQALWSAERVLEVRCPENTGEDLRASADSLAPQRACTFLPVGEIGSVSCPWNRWRTINHHPSNFTKIINVSS